MTTIILMVIVITLVAIFSVQNAMPVAITFLFWKFEASLAIVLFLTMVAGVILGAVAISLLRIKSAGKKVIGEESKLSFNSEEKR